MMTLDGRVIYQLAPGAFADGGLNGIRRRLDHIRALGADTVWIQPFYVSPYRDGGYDVVDHRGVSQRFGTMADFDDLVARCHELDLRVVVGLIMQHTSSAHPWFRSAREDPSSPYRDFYVWAQEPHEDEVVKKPVFTGVEDSIWAYDGHAGMYYRHAFYRHQPDLDVGHPEVRADIAKTVRHWLDHGVDGFRVDAVPHMVKQAAVTDPRDDGYWFLTELAAAADGAPLMGEVDSEPSEYGNYFGDGNRLRGILDFWTNSYLFLALARRDAEPLERAMRRQPEPPAGCTYLNWLRNQDELNLALLEDDERADVMAAFAPDEDMRIYGRGIRRRLAPMLDFDVRRIAMAHALVMALPGVPIVRYGEEIGMDDDLSLPERNAVRTPMDWAAVERQELEPGSLLSRIAQLTRCRHELGELPQRRAEPVRFDHPSVFGVLHQRREGSVLMLANLADEEVHLKVEHEADLLADQSYEPAGADVVLGAYGYRWLRVK
ncbi:alpha-amylase family glycosyl hydrolase [Kribbella sp.]|uniref:alpha-amylase family glycosyl hydrolase n=1 Tax=Kribbella sp. TaxID=1871183 RepID=UPI002D721E1F|nr:alpha-amylase family glycosyl hydrolase [Kribbella sp.]HZX02931.1 alpha-amylase family glycosyl hydrolase [Kribbella sp.]